MQWCVYLSISISIDTFYFYYATFHEEILCFLYFTTIILVYYLWLFTLQIKIWHTKHMEYFLKGTQNSFLMHKWQIFHGFRPSNVFKMQYKIIYIVYEGFSVS